MVSGILSRACWKAKYDNSRLTGSRSTTTIFGASHTSRTMATSARPPEK
jgi:hypothetical protein